MGNKYLILDYETFSPAPLKEVGAYEYAAHSLTEILCASFSLGTREELPSAPVLTWSPFGLLREKYSESFPVLLQAFLDPKVTIVAHNAFFEYCVTKFVFARLMYSKPYLRTIPVSRYEDTAALGRAQGLPSKLEELCSALNLKHQKDLEGHRLMLKLSKPRKPTLKDKDTRHRNILEYERLVKYCERDILAEREAFLRLTPLNEAERKFWEFDFEMNLQGVRIDRDLVNGALSLLDIETREIDRKVKKLTRGKLESARQRDAFLDYANSIGAELETVQAPEVAERLKSASGELKELLELRVESSRSSTAKFLSFEARSRVDSRARGNLIYYGAHTGRYSGTGIQLQNLFKSKFDQSDVEACIDLIKNKDRFTIQALFENPMALYSSMLRSCIVPREGCVFDVGDFSGIELRVLFWLAGHEEGLDAIRGGQDLYVDQASEIFSESAKELLSAYKSGDKDARFKRELGKRVVLGAGFGIGAEKFFNTCLRDGVKITESLATKAVGSYRRLHYPVPLYWTAIERAAIESVRKPTKTLKLDKLLFRTEKDFLKIKLPSERVLYYAAPKVEKAQGLYGERETLTYKGVNSVTRKFMTQKVWGGVLTENVVQAIARDVLRDSIIRLKGTEHRPVLSVHDENITERSKNSKSTLENFTRIMSEVPAWAKGLPIKVESWSGERYRK